MRHMIRRCAQYAALFYSLKKRSRIAREICGEEPLYLPADLMVSARRRYGLPGLAAADAVLFGWCFAAEAALDALPPDLRIPAGILGFLLCTAAFCLCGDSPLRLTVKTGYLIYAFACGSPKALTTAFMILYEHITALIRENGEED